MSKFVTSTKSQALIAGAFSAAAFVTSAMGTSGFPNIEMGVHR